MPYMRSFMRLFSHRYLDAYHYLIFTTSFKTKEEVWNYKSLDAYKYFIDGWVLEASWTSYSDVILLAGKVKHSYAASLSPLRPWVAIRKNGIVECDHCTCMAGLAETCSHIAGMLYWRLLFAFAAMSPAPQNQTCGYLHLCLWLATKYCFSPWRSLKGRPHRGRK